jgi:polyhydroxybutyrate depolymerase
MKSAARSFRMHEEMPEAVVVYMQGLPTVTPNDPEGRRNGWQGRADTNGDRDLKFFDAVLASLTSRYGVDTSRVFALGHSNGGRFTYLLWAERGEVFRAFGPSGSGSVGLELVPRPFFHVAGEKDPIVAFSKQRQSVVSQLERQGCPSDPAGKRGFAWYYKGVGGNDAVTYFHPGGHEYPKEVPPLLAKFFRSL